MRAVCPTSECAVIRPELRLSTSHNRTWGSTGKLRGMEWIDKLDGAGYSRGSALTGRLLPAAREASHLFSFSVSSYLLSAWYQRDTGKYERRSCDPIEVFTLSPIL